MLDNLESFLNGADCIRVTLEEYSNLIDYFGNNHIPVWEPDYLLKWTTERIAEDGFVYVYWDDSDDLVSCFSLNSPDRYSYNIVDYKEVFITLDQQTSEASILLDLL